MSLDGKMSDAIDNELAEMMRDADALRRAAVEALDGLDRWAHQCHAAAVALVNSGRFGDCRVARGWARGVLGQHSWVVLSHDAYDSEATIIDPTLWSYDRGVDGVWVGTYRDDRHVPHGGLATIWETGRPDYPTDVIVELTPSVPLSDEAEAFLSILGGLDQRGWMALAELPPGGWPAGEILAAMDDTAALAGLIPIDRLGMLTDRNPGGLYLPTDEYPPHDGAAGR